MNSSASNTIKTLLSSVVTLSNLMLLQSTASLVLEHGRVVSGYMSLTPVSGQSMYMAYVIIGSSTIEELYRS